MASSQDSTLINRQRKVRKGGFWVRALLPVAVVTTQASQPAKKKGENAVFGGGGGPWAWPGEPGSSPRSSFGRGLCFLLFLLLSALGSSVCLWAGSPTRLITEPRAGEALGMAHVDDGMALRAVPLRVRSPGSGSALSDGSAETFLASEPLLPVALAQALTQMIPLIPPRMP